MDGMKNGFFGNLFQNTRNGLKNDDLQEFASLSSNIERVKFTFEKSKMDEKLKLKRHARDEAFKTNEGEIFFYKDLNCAMEMKKIGNKFFQTQKWNEALNFYNKGYLMLPSNESMTCFIHRYFLCIYTF
jgi:hypothetical protein